jgi:diazepam-binding inhibitor (GABA receptor modulator, acyl-CoA-binding protein)
MSDLKKKFEAATKAVTKLAKRPNNDQMLELYALYKQATDGDVKGSRPGMLDLTGRAKFDAWTKKKGLATSDAMKAYTDVVARLQKG